MPTQTKTRIAGLQTNPLANSHDHVYHTVRLSLCSYLQLVDSGLDNKISAVAVYFQFEGHIKSFHCKRNLQRSLGLILSTHSGVALLNQSFLQKDIHICKLLFNVRYRTSVRSGQYDNVHCFATLPSPNRFVELQHCFMLPQENILALHIAPSCADARPCPQSFSAKLIKSG